MKRQVLSILFFNSFLSLLTLAGPRENAFVYNEQHNNIKTIYRQGVFDSELPEGFQSEKAAVFTVPYYLIPLNSTELRQVMADSIPANIANHHIVEKNGVKFFKYLVHPAVLNYYAEKFQGRFEFVSAEKSEFLATPTASERSLVLLQPTESDYMVKLNLPLQINHRDRTMYPTEIKRGVWLTQVFRNIFARNPELKNRFFVFDEPYGVYPKIDGQALGGIVFRQFPNDFYSEGKRVIPLFSLLAIDPQTKKPLFFSFIQKDQDPWSWFENNVLVPFKEIINIVTYKEGISLELHSQNVVVEIDEKTNRLTGRYGYRDLGSTHLDFYTYYALNLTVPRLDMIQDAKRELGGAYANKTELEWLEYFFKKQISDLFFIQMASHGLITKEQRETYKAKAWQDIVTFHVQNYAGDVGHKNEVKSFDAIFKSVLKIQRIVSCSNVHL